VLPFVLSVRKADINDESEDQGEGIREKLRFSLIKLLSDARFSRIERIGISFADLEHSSRSGREHRQV
jgi:hypothetical protein